MKKEKIIALYGELSYPKDFLIVPFEILEYRRKLNITTSEFTFICEIFHLVSKDFNQIKDKDISENKIAFYRQRVSLKNKGYLKTKLQGNNKKSGIIYDFRELKKIIDKLKKSNKSIRENNLKENQTKKRNFKETRIENKKSISIPNGIDKLNKLLKVIEKKGDINETYKTITNSA